MSTTYRFKFSCTLKPCDATTELGIDEERFLTSCSMCANQEVNRCYGFTTDKTASVSAVVGLFNGSDLISVYSQRPWCHD